MAKTALALVVMVSFCEIVAATARSGRDPLPQAAKNYDAPGPFAVVTADFPDLRDSGRDGREVPIKVRRPDGDGPFPLVVMSHGGGGNRDSNVVQAEHLASHGYVVACPEHVFSNTARLRHYLSRAGGRLGLMEALVRITRDHRAVLERPLDIRFAIDRMAEWNREGSPLAGRIDLDRIAVGGHSFGAYTTMVVCGARPVLDNLDPPVEPGKGLAKGLGDPRVKVGIAMSPQGTGGPFFTRESYRTLDRPILCMSGSRDRQLGLDETLLPARRRLEVLRFDPTGRMRWLWLENADHLAFSANPRLRIQLPSPAREDVQRISRALMVVYLDLELRGDERAGEFLTERYVNSLRGEVVTGVRLFGR